MGNLGPKKTVSKVLYAVGGYELLFRQKKRSIIPSLSIRETPPKPLELSTVSAALEGTVEELRGFPFTTSNAGGLKVAFPRVHGHLGVSLVDPPASLDYDDAQQAVQLSYGQRFPVLGDLQVNVLSSGDWDANFSREIEDVGQLSGTLDAQLDWTMDLLTKYAAFRGVTPTVTYGANQEGMSVTAGFDKDLTKNVHGSYAIGNLPGKYNPADFVHDCKVVLSSEGSSKSKKKKDAEEALRQSVEVQGAYDRRLPNVPLRGSLAYTASLRGGELAASVDLDRYRLRCSTPHGQVSFAIDTTAGESGDGRAKELALKLGKISAAASLVNQEPRFRFSVGL